MTAHNPSKEIFRDGRLATAVAAMPRSLRPDSAVALANNPFVSLESVRSKDGRLTIQGKEQEGWFQRVRRNAETFKKKWRQELIDDRALFTDALVKLAARKGFEFLPDINYPTLEEGFIGSADLVLTVDVYNLRHIAKNCGVYMSPAGDTHSSTNFLAMQCFMGEAPFKETGMPMSGVTVPVYLLDSRAVEVLHYYEPTRALLPPLMNDFWQLLRMAEHDYLHAMTLAAPQIKWHLDRDSLALEDMALVNHHGGLYEGWSLSMHAAACAEIFTNKKAKQSYLGLVDSYFSNVLRLQKAFGAEDAETRELVTYFAEIGFDRMARVIAPDDADLLKSPAVRKMAQLSLSVPASFVSTKVSEARPVSTFDQYMAFRGYEKLWANCASRSRAFFRNFRDVYKPLHDPAADFAYTPNLAMNFAPGADKPMRADKFFFLRQIQEERQRTGLWS